MRLDMAAWLALIPAVSALLDKIIPDPEARDKAKIELLKAEREAELEGLRLALSADQMQAEINKVEAASTSVFVSGWRPFIGWICGIAFAYHFIVQPFMLFMYSLNGQTITLPVFNMEALNTVLMGMLGLGVMRSVEKIKGTK
jgi:hypothetical protein